MLITTLRFALSRKRPHGGIGEEQLAVYVEDLFAGQTQRDRVGNVHLDLRENSAHRTLFVAHLDTVHRADGRNKMVRDGWKLQADGAALGADDGAGVAMLCHLALAGIPGYYIFTRGEEVGGVGARYLADEMPDLLKQFDRAIAFDRRGIDSVITHQGWNGRCASDQFGDALSEQLNQQGLMYSPDDSGVYTDTAEFVDLIPECTNISVGYENEHSDKEYLDLDHLVQLSRVVLEVAWDELPVARDPTPVCDPFCPEQYDWELEEALVYALEGYTGDLVVMMAEAVYPEDPAHAARHIAEMRFHPEDIEEALDSVDVDARHAILTRLFDETCIYTRG